MSAIASFYLLSNRIINDLFRCLRLRNCGDFVGDNKSAKEHSASEISKIKDEVRYTQAGVNPIWIKTAYGICLNSNCGK